MEIKLSSYLIKILEEEKTVELLRQNLAKIIQFSPYSLFKYLDKNNKGFINLHDLKRFLYNSGINFNERNVLSLFNYYDRDRDNNINYHEFLNIVLPKNDSELRRIASQRNPVETYMLSYQVEAALKRLLEKELDSVDAYYLYALDLKSSYGFSAFKLFHLLDYFNTNYIEAKGLEIFLKSHGYLISMSELNNLIYRIDKDGDGKISYSEFEELFYFKENIRYSYRINDEISNNSFIHTTHTRRNDENKITVKENLNTSSLKASINNLDLRASMRTYTSPTRERKLNYSLEEKTYSPSIKFSSPVRVSSPLKKTVISPQRIETLSLRNSYSYLRSDTINYESRNILKTSHNNSLTYSNSRLDKSNYRSLELKTNPQNTDLLLYLVKHLKDIIELEVNLENLKEKFSLQPDMTINNLYRFFDKDFFGSIGLLDFKECLLGLDVFSSLDEVKLIYKRYNCNNSGRLRYINNLISFNEFSDMIVPKKYEYSKLVHSRVNRSEFNLSYDTRFRFINLLKAIKENEKNVDLYRRLLNEKYFFNSLEAFNIIKQRYREYFTIQDLQIFFENNSVIILSSEIELLFQRFDKNKDGMVNFQEVTYF